MISTVWNRLWQLHDETKALVMFSPKAVLKQFKGKNLQFNEGRQEHDVDLADEMEEAPAEHTQRLTTGPGGVDEGEPREFTTRQRVGMVLGPLLFVLMLVLPTPAGMEPGAQKMAAVALLMATWWMCESIPIPATSLLPIALFPLLGIMHTKQATAPYASHLIFLFMGGFIIALAMQRWNLHRRIAMNIVKAVGFSPGRLIFGFMVATAALSAFVSNTATTVMMMPIGLAIISHVVDEGTKEGLNKQIDFSPEKFAFGLNLMLGIAYAASIGGIATLIGTPPNTVLAGYLQKTYGYEITFANWMIVGVPLVVVMLPMCWLWLTRVANPMKLKKVPGGRDMISAELKKMGSMSTGERWTSLVFGLTAVGWIFRKQLGFLFADPNRHRHDRGHCALSHPHQPEEKRICHGLALGLEDALGRPDSLRRRPLHGGWLQGDQAGRLDRQPGQPARECACAGAGDRGGDPDHLPHRADLQYRHLGHGHADSLRGGHRAGPEPAAAGRAGCDCRVLRFYAAGGYPAKRHRFRFGLCDHSADG